MRPILTSAFLIFVPVLLIISRSQTIESMTRQTSAANYKLAMAQMMVEAGKLDANLDRAAKRIGEAAAHGAKIVVLPEVMDLGWTDPSAKTMAY